MLRKLIKFEKLRKYIFRYFKKYGRSLHDHALWDRRGQNPSFQVICQKMPIFEQLNDQLLVNPK